jgi:hypothetical protein
MADPPLFRVNEFLSGEEHMDQRFRDDASVIPGRILELGTAFWASKTLLSAVEIGLFTALAEVGPLDAESLRQRLGLHERSARDFFDALVALGMLERNADGRYTNTPETDLYLDRNKESYLGGLLEMFNARLYGFWGSLTEGLRTGKPQNEIKTGEDLFDALYTDPTRLKGFLKAMTGISRLQAKPIAEKFPWQDYKTFIDIGTAQGCLPVQIAQAYPHISGGGFDLPPVGPVFKEYVEAHGLSDRLRFYPGNFFEDPLPSADVLVMGHVLHDWDLAVKKLLLSKAHEALPSGGALIVYETIIDDERHENVVGLLMSLNMLIETIGGSDFTGADCIGWMREVGFREARVEPLVAGHSMVIGIK